ncbi:MAG TPA: DUF2358 domain-containing protein [Leptolyngbyaceae cyanobacterium M65_K2018_010]|nr:DUF2358 domain-containing protein [Leptolyngbyaceae cyanobacterium M65_K2018_010]
MDLLEQIRLDYQHFPDQQSYHLYAEDVYFKDPLNEFRGVQRYQAMIGFIGRWFRDIDLQLHRIEYLPPRRIRTQWTLNWVAPLPWRPPMSIPGHSDLELGEEGKIIAHIDYWDCSRLAVLKQLFLKTSH